MGDSMHGMLPVSSRHRILGLMARAQKTHLMETNFV